MRLTRGRRLVAFLSVAVVAWLTVEVDAQFRRGFGRGFGNVRRATEADYDGAFHFCRAIYRSDPRGDGGNWSVDWPRADINLSTRLGELTRTSVSKAGGEPNPLLVELTDDALFQCPFVMMTEVGSAFFDEKEAGRLKEYMLKGGFVWADDFWGSYAWSAWESEFAKVLPPARYPVRDLPLDHPLFKQMFVVPRVPQIPSINFWAGSGGGTSERGADSAVPHARGVFDPEGRLMVLITHNTDVGDSWEREADDPEYFLRFSVDGYAFAINVLLYALTH